MRHVAVHAALAKVVLKSPLPWIAVLLCQLVFLGPLAKGDDASGYFLGAEELKNDLIQAQSNMESGAYDGASEHVVDSARERINILIRATQTDDTHEYAELRAELEKNSLDAFDAGNLVGPTRKELEAKHRFYTLLAQQDDARIYQSYRETPALFYLPEAYAVVPLIMWMLPTVIMAGILGRAVRGTRLLAQAPLGRARSFVAQIGVLSILAVGSILLVMVPVFAVVSAFNGVGNPTYPVVNLLGASEVAVIETTVGAIIPQVFAMLCTISFFVAALVHAIARIVPIRVMWMGPAAALALLATPVVRVYIQMGRLTHDIAGTSAAVDPLTLVNPLALIDEYANIAGRANYWPHQALLMDERMTLGLSCAVLVGWGLVALLVAFAIVTVRGARLARKDRMVTYVQAGGLQASGVTLAYGKHRLVHDASCRVDAGSVTGLIAPNGCGKTTLLEALAGLNGARKTGGVHANGVSSARAAFRKLVLYVPCDAGLLYPNLTAADHIQLATALWPDKVDVEKLIDLCGLTGYLKRPVRAYSLGMKQQLALAVAYCTGARYLLLDEPMNALDPGNVALNTYIMRRPASQGTGIVLSSHILSNLDELCDVVIGMQDGELKRMEREAGHRSVRAIYEVLFGGLHVQTSNERRRGTL